MVNYILESLGIHYCTKVYSLVSIFDQLENLPLGGLLLAWSKGSSSPLPCDTSTLGKASFEGLVLKLELGLESPGGFIKTQSTELHPQSFCFSGNLHSNRFPGDVDAAGPGTTL